MEKKKVVKIRKARKFSIRKQIFIGIGIALAVVLLLAAVFASVFLPWKEVFLTVGDSKITYDEMNYQVYLASKTLNAPLPNLQSSDPKTLAASRNVLQLAYVNAISDAILSNKARQENLQVTESEIEAYISNLKNDVSSGFNDKDLALKDFLKTIGVKESALREIALNKIMANKEKEKLTSNITVTDEEVKSFYNDFWNAYVKNENEKEKYFAENYNKIKEDCLKNKKEQYVSNTLRRELINEEINNIEVDNPYKKLMRFWYGTFLGTDIPEIYRNVSIQELLT